MDTIKADSKELMNQAPETAGIYLLQAIKKIDEAFGSGYSKENPDLVIAFMKTASYDFTASIMAKAIFYATDEIVRGIDNRWEK